MGMSKSSAVQRFVVCALATCLAGLACTSGSARDDVPDDATAMKNPVALEESEIRYYQRQFKGKCSRCHGIDGTGSGVDATSTEEFVRPANFTDAKYMASRTDGQLFYQIVMGGGERCAMPAFGPESDYAWNEDKIWHMVAFIRRFSDSSSP
jgi:mono/diheme cytochrome c family protein